MLQPLRQKHSDDIGTATRAPIMNAKSSLITTSARHIAGKTAFIDVNDGSPCRLMGGNAGAKGIPLIFARLRVFIGNAKAA